MEQRKRNQSGYLFKSHGSWFVRYREPDGTQRAHRLASVEDYLKKLEVKSLAQEHMNKVNSTSTSAAGGTIAQFWDSVFLPDIKRRLSKSAQQVYPKMWRGYLLERIGHLRLRDVCVADMQMAFDSIHRKRGEEISHSTYVLVKAVATSLFSHALRYKHVASNPVKGTSVSKMGHTNHRENGAYSLDEIRQLLTLFPAGPVAIVIGVNAFLGLRRPEAEALMPDDYDGKTMRIHRSTKTGNDHCIPVIAPLRRLLVAGWERINLSEAEDKIREKITGTSLRWKGWYAFRRGLATNLWELGVPPEVACLILRNSKEVCSKHYVRLDAQVKKTEAMSKLEIAWENGCAAVVQQ